MKHSLLILALAFSAYSAQWTNSTADQLQSVLTNSSVVAGDVIWLRGGTYVPVLRLLTGTNIPAGGLAWRMSLNGSAGNLIIIKSYPGELAKLDRPWQMGASTYVKFTNLEFYDSLKGFNPGNPSYPNARPWGHFENSVGVSNLEWVNCIVHDINQGWGTSAAGRSIRGCIIWHSGNSSLDHVCYNCPNEFIGNIIGWNTCDALNLNPFPFLCMSNIFFGAGQTLNGTASGDMRLNTNSVVAFNYIYNRYTNNVLATSSIMSDGAYTVSNNVINSFGASITFPGTRVSATVLNNNFHMGQTYADYVTIYRGNSTNSWTFENNHYSAAPPSRSVRIEDYPNISRTFAQWQTNGFDATGSSVNSTFPSNSVHVIPNQDELKRAHIAVFNYTSNDVVSVSLSGVLEAGNIYNLYSAQNYAGGSIQTGIYNGTNITVPMTNFAVAPLVYSDPARGLIPVAHTGQRFGAFVLIGGETHYTYEYGGGTFGTMSQ